MTVRISTYINQQQENWSENCPSAILYKYKTNLIKNSLTAVWIKQQLCIYSPVDICMWSKHLVTTTFIVPFPLLYWLQPSWDVPRFWVWEYQWQQHHGRSGQQQQQQQLLQLQSSVFPMLLHEWLKKNKVSFHTSWQNIFNLFWHFNG